MTIIDAYVLGVIVGALSVWLGWTISGLINQGPGGRDKS